MLLDVHRPEHALPLASEHEGVDDWVQKQVGLDLRLLAFADGRPNDDAD